MNKKNMLAIVIGLMSLGIGSAQASDGGWCHLPFNDGSGTQIRVDYAFQNTSAGRFGYYKTGKPWIHVKRAGLTGSEGVRAVVQVHNAYSNPTEIFDLAYDPASGGFAGEVPEYISLLRLYGTRPSVQLTVAIVVNGQWLKDPATGQDFLVNIEGNPGQCD